MATLAVSAGNIQRTLDGDFLGYSVAGSACKMKSAAACQMRPTRSLLFPHFCAQRISDKSHGVTCNLSYCTGDVTGTVTSPALIRRQALRACSRLRGLLDRRSLSGTMLNVGGTTARGGGRTFWTGDRNRSLCIRCKGDLALNPFGGDAFSFDDDDNFEKWAMDSGVVEGEGLPSPWLGAVMFRRSNVQKHYDLYTSLERLDLKRFSSETSLHVARMMGVKADEQNPNADNETPVCVAMDVTRDGKDLQLEGVIRTAITAACNRCLAPVAQRVFADFQVRLMAEPPKQPTAHSSGVLLGDDFRPIVPAGGKAFSAESSDGGDMDELLDLDIDDKLHFPPEAKEMDLSSYVRDTIFLELPLRILCDETCKGFCSECGVNLNRQPCKCEEGPPDGPWGPLDELKRQLQ